MKHHGFVSLVAVSFLAVALALAGCGSSTPKQLTLERDATLCEAAYDSDGDPTIRELGTVPAGAVCTYTGILSEFDVSMFYALVEDCTLDGVNYGDGGIYYQYFVESDSLR